MTRSPRARSGDIEFDGFGPPVFFTSGRLTSINGTVQYNFVCPFDGYITQFLVNIDTAFTNAAAEVICGLRSDTDSHLDDPTIQNLTGLVDFTGYASGAGGWVTKAVTRGALMAIGFINADTTGNGTITVGIAPVQAPA